MNPTPTELKEILRLHDLFLKGDTVNGKRADLSYANLRYANLRSANLSSANLSSANLRSADLSSANLRSADLSSANLRSANLSSANLRSANLSYADLSYAVGIQYAQCSFVGHGECGRMLTLIEYKEKLIFFCGCFKGSPEELKQYIKKGKPELAASRNLAMNFCMEAIKMKSNAC